MMEREPKSGPPSAISGKRAAVQKIRFLWKTDKNGVWSFPEPNVDPVIQRFESLLAGTNLVGSSGDAILDSFDPSLRPSPAEVLLKASERLGQINQINAVQIFNSGERRFILPKGDLKAFRASAS